MDVIVTQPTNVTQRVPPPQDIPKTGLSTALSCFVAWCCCCPMGLAAFILAMMSSKHVEKGDLDTARQYNKTSMILSYVGLAIGVVILIVMVAINATG